MIAEAVLTVLLRPWFARSPRSAAQIEASGPQRLLLVKTHDQIGDMVCATPAIRAIRRRFPEAHLAVACAGRHESLLRHNPDIDELLVFNRHRFNRSWRAFEEFRRALRKARPDGAFVLDSVSFSTTSALIAGASAAEWIVGGTSAVLGWDFTRWMYSLETEIRPVPEVPAVRHTVHGLRAVGFELEDFDPVLVIDDESDRRAREFLDGVGSGPRVAIHPGAGKTANRWPLKSFVDLIGRLRDRGASVWIVEGPADATRVEELFAQLGGPLPALRNEDLLVVAAALRASDRVLVHDTGTMHLAGAVGVPGVALFGPTSPEIWAPPASRLQVLRADDQKVGSIPVEEVLEALLS
jgi:heptosyltransferase-2